MFCDRFAQPSQPSHSCSPFSPSSDELYLLHHTLRDMYVLHGNDICQFIQGVDILDLIHELHTAEGDRATTTTKPL